MFLGEQIAYGGNALESDLLKTSALEAVRKFAPQRHARRTDTTTKKRETSGKVRIQRIRTKSRFRFRDLTQKRIRRGVFRSVPEMIAGIEKFPVSYDHEPKPFDWTASTNAIVEKAVILKSFGRHATRVFIAALRSGGDLSV